MDLNINSAIAYNNALEEIGELMNKYLLYKSLYEQLGNENKSLKQELEEVKSSQESKTEESKIEE